MRPKQQPKARHDDLFRARLDRIVNMKHKLVILAAKIDWTWIDEQLAGCFSDVGRPAEPVRFMIGMFMLKHTYGLSDEQTWERWVQDPFGGKMIHWIIFFATSLPVLHRRRVLPARAAPRALLHEPLEEAHRR